MAQKNEDEAAITVEFYVDALSCRSNWALHEAYMKIARGEADKFSKTFMPKAPELSQLCKEIEENMLASMALLEKRLNADEEKSFDITKKADPAKIAALMADYKQTQGQEA